MTTYVYNCKECCANKEIVHGMTETPVLNCLVCSTQLTKVITSGNFQLKGKGWFHSKKEQNDR